MMRVLVLGGGGFVGGRIVAALAASGRAVPVIAARRAQDDAQVVAFDALDPAALAKALDGVDAVVNCVSGGADTIQRGAQALAQVAGGRRIVHLSSMAVYGSAHGLVAENAPLKGDIGAYSAAKIDAEAVLAPCNAVMLRPGCVAGPGGRLWTARVAQLLAAGRIGDLGAAGMGCSNVIDVDDLAQAVLAALFLPQPGAFNLALPGAPTWNDYFALFAAELDLPYRTIAPWRLAAEGWLLAVPLKLGEKLGMNLPPPIARSQLRLWAQDIRMDMGAADTHLAMAWTPLAQTLARSAAWVRPALRAGTAPPTERQGE
jgi:nucleoside-diphosphate-sugar epimerase